MIGLSLGEKSAGDNPHDGTMRDFVIFFSEKEGTSPLVRLLDHFEHISIIHQINNAGWEPFDHHNCGAMSLRSLEECLNLLFGRESLDMERVNQIYTKTARKPLEKLKKGGSLGFKMRFRPPGGASHAIHRFIHRTGLFDRYPNSPFKKTMIDVLRRNKVVVFLAVRQDVFRWALSKYHGDGTGRRGHLQFGLASGRIREDEIGKIHVNCNKLGRIIARCERDHARKRHLMDELRREGIETYPLKYEDFVSNRVEYLRRFCEILNIAVSVDDISSVLNRGTGYEKFHSDQISSFVENHEAVTEKFGQRFCSW